MKATKKLYNLQSLNFLRHTDNLKVGILGGSFNPAHAGHFAISEQAIKKFGMDYVIWLVANQNPLKTSYNTSIIDRASSAVEVASNPRILVSTLESELGTYYTYDSMMKLKGRFPNVDFTWLMGIDNMMHFHKWYKYRQFAQLCKIIIFDRPVAPRLINFGRFMSELKPIVANSQSDNIIVYRGKLSSVSSTSIRQSNKIGTL